jgi:hypothetical protein
VSRATVQGDHSLTGEVKSVYELLKQLQEGGSRPMTGGQLPDEHGSRFDEYYDIILQGDEEEREISTVKLHNWEDIKVEVKEAQLKDTLCRVVTAELKGEQIWLTGEQRTIRKQAAAMAPYCAMSEDGLLCRVTGRKQGLETGQLGSLQVVVPKDDKLRHR